MVHNAVVSSYKLCGGGGWGGGGGGEIDPLAGINVYALYTGNC